MNQSTPRRVKLIVCKTGKLSWFTYELFHVQYLPVLPTSYKYIAVQVFPCYLIGPVNRCAVCHKNGVHFLPVTAEITVGTNISGCTFICDNCLRICGDHHTLYQETSFYIPECEVQLYNNTIAFTMPLSLLLCQHHWRISDTFFYPIAWLSGMIKGFPLKGIHLLGRPILVSKVATVT